MRGLPLVERLRRLGRELLPRGGATVRAGDIVVADEDGAVVVPAARGAEILAAAHEKLAAEAAQSLDEWEAAHRAKIDAILREQG